MIGPNFFIIGAPKAATTSLASLLEQHPQAAIAQTKEPHFFTDDEFYATGWNMYLTMFTHCVCEIAVGDASTSYSRIRAFPGVVERIKRHVPQAKIIYMVRHPLKRMESAYIEIVSTAGGEPFRSINDAVRQLPMIIDSSRYWEVFDAYSRQFDRSRIKIIWFEDYANDTASVFREVCQFLEIDDAFLPDLNQQRFNSRESASHRLAKIGRSHLRIDTNWDEQTRRMVIDQIRQDNLKFLDYFGRPPNHWGDIF